GYGSDSGHDKSTTHSGINTSNISITNPDEQKQNINDVHTDVTTDNYTEHAGYLSNNFDKDKVQQEIDTQVDVSKEFSQNTQQLMGYINGKKDKLKAERDKGNLTEEEYNNQVGDLDKVNVLIGMIAGGLGAPTSNAAGIIAATASPAVAYEIGQYFKENGGEGSSAHLLAHAALGAAVAAAGGNNALVGAASAAGAEAAAPALAHWLYDKDPSDLTSDEKQTISSIVGLAGAAVGATTGNSADIAGGFQGAQNAVNNNDLIQIISPASAAMLSRDPERRKAMWLISQIRSGNQKITLAIYAGGIAIVGGGMVAPEAAGAIYSACMANLGTCTVIGVDSVDTIAGLATGAVTVGSLAPNQVVSKGKQALEELKGGAKVPKPSAADLHNSTSNVDNVIKESLSGKKNFTSQSILTEDEALTAGEKFLGTNYKEIGKPGSGVYRSADGTREFRIDRGSLSGSHSPHVPHVHFSVINTETGKVISNNHVPIKGR
ncbi:VENN motif pre-toxin domain-containing protein, partial [Neisseriaceae bacterium ESL0693]|nr:VENN motif pre-toxin domain-containing protein [Neisseriaceae bacterium ESL0693]